MAEIKEAVVIINGKQLTTGQAMTLRVAVGSFIFSLQGDGLGDEHVKNMTAAYLLRAREIEALLVA